eukprot:s976_g2.t1
MGSRDGGRPSLATQGKEEVQRCNRDDSEMHDPETLAEGRFGVSTTRGTTDTPCAGSPISIGEGAGPLDRGEESELNETELRTAGSFFRCCPESRQGWLAKLESVKELTDMGIWLAWGLAAGWLTELCPSAGPRRSSERKPRSGELFPLPVILPADMKQIDNETDAGWKLDLSVRCWTAVCCAATNVLYQCSDSGLQRKPGKVHARALEVMGQRIRRLLEGCDKVDGSFEETVEDLKNKRVNYVGEEVSQPHALTVNQIRKGLPPKGHGGSIPILPFLRGRTKYLMKNPLESMLDESERGGAPVTARVHIKKGEELEVFNLLEERGVIQWVPEDLAFSDCRGTYLSGLFGVVKQGKFTEDHLPILRVITNLIPVNGLFSILRGDIDYLPSATGWMPMLLSNGDVVSMSQSDMASAFYLFAIPEEWYPFFCLNFVTSGSSIGRPLGGRYRPAIKVLPMGWASSVGVMQQISREILLCNGLPPELEFKKTGGVPLWFTKVMEATSSKRAWWQVYLDNFMSGECHDGHGGSIGVDLQQRALEAWERTGVLSATDKQVLDSKEVVELGVRFDGSRGLLGASESRLLKTIWASLYLLRRGHWSQKEAQVVLGRWIFILQFRRAAMGTLSRSWRAVEGRWPRPEDKNGLLREIMTLICLGPLLQTDLSSGYDGRVSCSDASETGGAAAVSKGLTWSGRSLAAVRMDARLAALEVPVVVVSCFNGIGGAFRIYDILGLSPMGRISIEIYKPGNRTTRTTWPGVIELHDIETVDEAEIRRWANMFPRIQELHLYAGFPCIHLSAVRAGRKNLDGEGSNLFWKLVEVIKNVQKVFSPFCRVRFCVENVASMDEDARFAISDTLEVAPVKLDPADCMCFSRPRFAWCSETLHQMDGIELWTEREYVRAYLSADSQVSTAQWIRPGWTWTQESTQNKFPTFMKAIKRQRPPPVPVGLNKATPTMVTMWTEDEYRFPPYQYHPRFWLEAPNNAPRLLDASERELLLGFGPGHTDSCQSASVKKRNLREHEDIRKSLCGDSFAILPFAVMGACMCSALVPRMSPSQILRRLGLAPGATAHPCVEIPISRYLSYGGDVHRPVVEEDLVRQLGLSVNHTGADVRILRRTRAERCKRRKGISLKAFTIAEKTRKRYEVAVGLILPFLEQHGLENCDDLICEWIELQWARGESVSVIADCFSGLHYFLPYLKGTLKQAWRLFKSWRRVETPCRAAPITVLLVKAMVARAVDLKDVAFATFLALGFHALLRSGELLSLQFQDVEFTGSCGVVTLRSSKSGLRHGTEEAVAIREPLCLQLLETLFSMQAHSPGHKLWPHSAQYFRDTFRRYLRYFRLLHLSFKPYSLRRGGATFLLQEGVPLETILLRGRWRSVQVARLYLEDGLAQIPAIRIPASDLPRIHAYSMQAQKAPIPSHPVLALRGRALGIAGLSTVRFEEALS